MTNKTPFELRFDALQEATSLLTQEYFAKLEAAKEVFTGTNLANKLQEIAFPSPDAIMELAGTFDRFINGKSKQS